MSEDVAVRGRRYLAFGLVVDSEFELPGALAGGVDGRADLTIVAGRVAAGPVEARSEGTGFEGTGFEGAGPEERGPYGWVDGGLVFTMAYVARYRCEAGGARLTVDAEAGAEGGMVVAMLLATALPMALWMRGQVVLHAGAAVLPGGRRAVAFAGSSGVGKSTLLRGLVGAAGLVADDMLAIDARGICCGLPGGTWLRAGEGRRFEPVPPERRLAHAELGLVVVLEAGAGDGSDDPVRLRGGAALAALLGQVHRPRVPRMLGGMAAVLPALARMVRTTPVYCWQIKPADGDISSSAQAVSAALGRLAAWAEERHDGGRDWG